jgi:hypothetical protein
MADGTNTEESDIDFYVEEDHPDMKANDPQRNAAKIIRVLEKHGIKWGSSFPGSIHTHNISGNGYLPVMLDFSDVFKKRRETEGEIELFGIKFKTV